MFLRFGSVFISEDKNRVTIVIRKPKNRDEDATQPGI